MSWRFSRYRITPFIRIGSMLRDKINMRLIKQQHLRRKKKYCVIIYFFMRIKSPAKAAVGDSEQTNKENYFFQKPKL
jgi:hypothetical protein